MFAPDRPMSVVFSKPLTPAFYVARSPRPAAKEGPPSNRTAVEIELRTTLTSSLRECPAMPLVVPMLTSTDRVDRGRFNGGAALRQKQICLVNRDPEPVQAGWLAYRCRLGKLQPH